MECASCKFAHPTMLGPKLHLKCRRFPPVHDFTLPGPNRPALFPTVIEGYYCHEYIPKNVVLEAVSEVKRGRPKKAE